MHLSKGQLSILAASVVMLGGLVIPPAGATGNGLHENDDKKCHGNAHGHDKNKDEDKGKGKGKGHGKAHGHDKCQGQSEVDRIIAEILSAEPGASRAGIKATIGLIAREADVSRVEAAKALLAEFLDDSAQVAADAQAAAESTSERGGMNARDDSNGDGGRIRIPAANEVGDIVYAPNVSHRWNHGHAAIFKTRDVFVHAPGGSARVQEMNRRDPRANKFAVDALMMSVYTDEGEGPLLSLTKRQKAADWAEGRIGDRYRGVHSPNAKVVTGPVGSDGSKQNCSQLVWAAYKVANDYDFNPIGRSWLLGLAGWQADKRFVWPSELVDADQTRVYAKITTDIED